MISQPTAREMRQVRQRCATAAMLATLGVLLATQIVWSPSLALAASRAGVDRSRIVLKLTPAGTGTQKLTAGRSGRSDFDQIVVTSAIQSVQPVFVPPPRGHRLEASAAQGRMSDYVVVEVPGAADPDALMQTLLACPDVESAEFDVTVRTTGSLISPDDPFYPTHQYAPNNTGSQPPTDPGTVGADLEMEAAWGLTTGDPGVVIAILDTGIDPTHPDLAGRFWINEDETNDEFDTDGNGFAGDRFGWNFDNNTNSISDFHSHGTHVAGIAGATGNNAMGIAGMDWNCRLMPVKVLGNDGSGSSAAVAAGITYAVIEGADVISMSLGAFGTTSAEEVAIEFATSSGVVVVAAMGNDDVGDLFYPAAHDSVISVGATDSDDLRADPFCFDPINSGSNYGEWIDVCAPGDYVWSLMPTTMASYGTKCGTSMATPHVSGLVALMLALRPDYTADSVRRMIRLGTEDQVGRPTEDLAGFDIYHGWGRVNARTTLQAISVGMRPIVSVPGPQAVSEAGVLAFDVSAIDSNFTIPSLSLVPLPNAVMNDHGDGTGDVVFSPDYTQAGVHDIRVIASDGVLADTQAVSVDVAPSCLCLCQGDPQCDGETNVLDVVGAVNVAFRDEVPIVDAACDPHPGGRTDTNCDGFTNVLDVVVIVNIAFRNEPSSFCQPCTP